MKIFNVGNDNIVRETDNLVNEIVKKIEDAVKGDPELMHIIGNVLIERAIKDVDLSREQSFKWE